MQEQGLNPYELDMSTAILAVDTLWGGDVGSASGTGRFIADAYFSGKPLPAAYSDPLAVHLRAEGGVLAARPDLPAARGYLERFDIPAALDRVRAMAHCFPKLRRCFVEGLVVSLEVMLDLALEVLGLGPAVDYERCVRASCGREPVLVDPLPLHEELRALLSEQGFEVAGGSSDGLLDAVRSWRGSRAADKEGVARVAETLIPELDAATRSKLVPHLPLGLGAVPRTNVRFLPIEDTAWFSSSMRYLGLERSPEGDPQYEASFKINAALEISKDELRCLVAHEVVPGHVMTFALLQNLYHRGRLGFEATIPMKGTRACTLHEGIANAAILLVHGVGSGEDLGDPGLRTAFLFSRLQDIAKNNASFLTWAEHRSQEEIAGLLRTTCMLSQERARELGGVCAQHPVLGRMYMPSHDAGARLVLSLLSVHGARSLIPLLYGARGLLDCVTLRQALEG